MDDQRANREASGGINQTRFIAGLVICAWVLSGVIYLFVGSRVSDADPLQWKFHLWNFSLFATCFISVICALMLAAMYTFGGGKNGSPVPHIRFGLRLMLLLIALAAVTTAWLRAEYDLSHLTAEPELINRQGRVEMDRIWNKRGQDIDDSDCGC